MGQQVEAKSAFLSPPMSVSFAGSVSTAGVAEPSLSFSTVDGLLEALSDPLEALIPGVLPQACAHINAPYASESASVTHKSLDELGGLR